MQKLLKNLLEAKKNSAQTTPKTGNQINSMIEMDKKPDKKVISFLHPKNLKFFYFFPIFAFLHLKLFF